MKLTSIVFTALILAPFLTSITGCKKSNQQPDPVAGGHEPDPTPVVSKFASLSFSSETIKTENVDSVVVVLTSGDRPSVRKKFVKNETRLQMDFDGMAAGEWQMALSVFSKDQENGNKFTMAKNVTLPLTGEMKITAPDNKLNSQWKAWFLLQNENVKFYVPMDPSDPLFEIEVKSGGWEYINVQKVLKLANATVESAEWSCQGDCFTQSSVISNSTHFLNFSQKAKTVNWDGYEVLIQLLNEDQSKDLTEYRLYKKQ